jgi:hypothetical protein
MSHFPENDVEVVRKYVLPTDAPFLAIPINEEAFRRKAELALAGGLTSSWVSALVELLCA